MSSQPEAVHPTISRPPTSWERFGERAFRGACFAFAWLTILVVLWIVGEIGWHAYPAMRSQGIEFLTTTKWDASNGKFGVLAEIGGTLYSSVLGVGVATILGLAVAIVLTQDFLPPSWAWGLKSIVELLAAIPSVVYGLWGIFVVLPLMRAPAAWLHAHLDWIPLFNTRLAGPAASPTRV